MYNRLIVSISIIWTLVTIRMQGEGVSIRIKNNVLSSQSLYRAPSSYASSIEKSSSENIAVVPQSFIITSRPLTFIPEKGYKPTMNSNKTPMSTKVQFVPGFAKVVCKGKTCGQGTRPLTSDHHFFEDGGFAGEAIPIDPDDDHNIALILNGGKDTPQLLTTAFPTTTTTSSYEHPFNVFQVSLLTNRPYLDRMTEKPTVATTKRRPTRATTTRIRRRTTTTKMTSVQPHRPPLSDSVLSSPTVSSSVVRPVKRPNLFFPAMAAFSLMALPVAAAAVPLFLGTGKRKRRRKRRDLVYWGPSSSSSSSSTFGPITPSVSNKFTSQSPSINNDDDDHHFEPIYSDSDFHDDIFSDLDELTRETFPVRYWTLVSSHIAKAKDRLLKQEIKRKKPSSVDDWTLPVVSKDDDDDNVPFIIKRPFLKPRQTVNIFAN